MSTGTNPFEQAEAWEVSAGGGWLQEGEYVVTIDDVEEETASTGNPGAKFYMSNSQGRTEFRCWYGLGKDGLPFLSKIVAVFDAAGVPRPDPGKGEASLNDRFRIRLDVLKRLVGKQVGVVIKPEPDQNDPGKTWNRAQGCVHPSRITSGADAQGLPAVGQQAGNGQAPVQQPGERPLPF